MVFAEDRSFRSIAEGLFVRRDAESTLEVVDAIILDIDGVLVDVRESFRYTICDTVQFFFAKTVGAKGRRRLVHPEDTDALKMAGGFNSDWDLTEAAVLFLLWKLNDQELRGLDELALSRPSLQAFAEELGSHGGGLHKAYEWIANRLEQEGKSGLGERLRQQVDGPLIRRIFQEHYAGQRYCRRLYGFDPGYYHGPGSIRREKAILDRGLWPPKGLHCGIFSGRTPEEIELALELMGICVEPRLIVGDDGSHPTKPDPWGLFQLEKRLNWQAGMYAGDTWDDLRTVLTYREGSGSKPVLFCYCSTGNGNESALAFFRRQGADMIARDVNALLVYLGSLAGPRNRGSAKACGGP
jgi:HAD superfamily phosphatase